MYLRIPLLYFRRAAIAASARKIPKGNSRHLWHCTIVQSVAGNRWDIVAGQTRMGKTAKIGMAVAAVVEVQAAVPAAAAAGKTGATAVVPRVHPIATYFHYRIEVDRLDCREMEEPHGFA